jgi:hypothetical protein
MEACMELVDFAREQVSGDIGEELIRIEDLGYVERRATKVWRVFNSRYNQSIGWIRWHDARRRYCFCAEATMHLDHETLRLISEFLEAQMRIRAVRPDC